MVDLVLTFHSVDVADVPELTLPVSADQAGTYYYKGGNYGDISSPPSPRTTRRSTSSWVWPPTTTPSRGERSPPSSVTVSVMNGSGVYSEGAETADSLQALGFHIGTVGTTAPVGRQAETVVAYSAVSASELAAAQSVADSLSGAVILAYDPSQVPAGSQVTVVAGTDVTVHPPAAPPASPTAVDVARWRPARPPPHRSGARHLPHPIQPSRHSNPGTPRLHRVGWRRIVGGLRPVRPRRR